MDALKLGEYIHLSGGIPALVVEILSNQVRVRSILGEEVLIEESKAQYIKADMQTGLMLEALNTIRIAPIGFEYAVSIKHPSLGILLDEGYRTGEDKTVNSVRYFEKEGNLCRADIVNNEYALTTLGGRNNGRMSLEKFSLLGIHSIPQLLLSAVKNYKTLPSGTKISVSILNPNGDIMFDRSYTLGKENRISDG